MSTAVQSPARITISEDKLRAELVVTDPDPEAITSEKMVETVRESGVPVTDQITERVNAVAESVKAGQLPDGPTLLAEGREPVPGVPASFQLVADDTSSQEDDDDEGRVDFHQSRIVTVNVGDEVGTFTPEVPPVPGVDVFGAPIPGEKVPRCIELGENVKLGENGKTVIAAISGKVHVARREVSVMEVVEIKGDVDYSSGDIDSPTDVLITGTVRETFSVRSAKSVAVQGAIEAATVEAGTDAQIKGGITARGAGGVRAGGEICAKFCEEADLQAEGDITITREVMNSMLYTAGRLFVPRGSVIGGYAYAREGAELREIGNETDIRTEIAIGVDPVVLAEASRSDEIINKKREAAARIREKVQPLMAEPKRLTPPQRERATELMYEADQIEAEILEYEKKKEAAIAAKSPAPDSKPELLVTGKIYRGAAVIFGNKMALIDRERRGPIKIVRRPVKNVQEIVVADQVSGSMQILASYEYKPDLAFAEPDD